MIREQIIKELVRNKDVLDIGSFGQTDSYSLWNLYSDFEVKSLTGIDIEGLTFENQKLLKLKLQTNYIIL
ncbi:MAG TPA: hypothetical protein P5239_08800 [Victivallales bacterium]|nr:hypothetical protein [Victivallales bacterium]